MVRKGALRLYEQETDLFMCELPRNDTTKSGCILYITNVDDPHCPMQSNATARNNTTSRVI